jgi:hypothetical protein
VVNVTPQPLYPPGKTRYPLHRKMGGSQGRFGLVRKFSSPTGIRFQDRPSRSDSLFRLSYPGTHYTTCAKLSQDFWRKDIFAFFKRSSRPLEPNPSHVLWVTSGSFGPKLCIYFPVSYACYILCLNFLDLLTLIASVEDYQLGRCSCSFSSKE